ncbi:MAG: hypothetical protein JO267_14095 [Alphaproteobacteria bacterium]|nr:hypothetical protein [Alphaproteobacteria bacterium]
MIRFRTLPGYGFGVLTVLAIVNAVAWSIGETPRLHGLQVFSAGFLMGVLGTNIAAHLYGYRQVG